MEIGKGSGERDRKQNPRGALHRPLAQMITCDRVTNLRPVVGGCGGGKETKPTTTELWGSDGHSRACDPGRRSARILSFPILKWG